MIAGETHQAIEATFRIERARLIAGLARVVRNVDLAEEFAQDALVVALAEWPKTGVPANPGAWLMAVAKRRAVARLVAVPGQRPRDLLVLALAHLVATETIDGAPFGDGHQPGSRIIRNADPRPLG